MIKFWDVNALRLWVQTCGTNIKVLKISFDEFEILKYHLGNCVNFNNLLKKLLKELMHTQFFISYKIYDKI